MTEIVHEAKQSKRMIILACCSQGIFIALFIGLTIMFSFAFIGATTDDEYTGYLFCIVWSAATSAICIAVLAYLIYIYKKHVDIYKSDRFVRTVNGKVVFEVLYENIVSVRVGFFDSLFITLKTPIVKVNGKKGPRNFYEHYSRYDIHFIKRAITDRYYKIPIID